MIASAVIDLPQPLSPISPSVSPRPSCRSMPRNASAGPRPVERVAVMYAGTVVDTGPTADVFARLAHPYTRGLFAARPQMGAARIDGIKPRLATIAGRVPELTDLPRGCAFADRCGSVIGACRTAMPALVEVSEGHMARCIRIGEST